MPANTTPIFTLTPIIAIGQVSVANPNRDGTGTVTSILTGDTNGTLIYRIIVKATVTTTAGMVRLFIDDGTYVRLYREILVTATTVSASVAGFETIINFPAGLELVLPANYILKACTEKAEAINIIVEGGNF